MAFLKQYEILLKKAKVDLKVSKNLLEDFENGDDELDLDVIMFHLQQSAEKLLKSLLSYSKLHYTKTHDIKSLIDALKDNNIEISIKIELFIPLTDYAVEGRYAIVHDDLSDVDKYIKKLDSLVLFVESKI
ncbi:MAG: HEPN domain-containing protein [Campylobacterota bacterium]|nr:HEPN domain-containing protein [Campylobacterota bacterium]